MEAAGGEGVVPVALAADGRAAAAVLSSPQRTLLRVWPDIASLSGELPVCSATELYAGEASKLWRLLRVQHVSGAVAIAAATKDGIGLWVIGTESIRFREASTEGSVGVVCLGPEARFLAAVEGCRLVLRDHCLEILHVALLGGEDSSHRLQFIDLDGNSLLLASVDRQLMVMSCSPILKEVLSYECAGGGRVISMHHSDSNIYLGYSGLGSIKHIRLVTTPCLGLLEVKSIDIAKEMRFRGDTQSNASNPFEPSQILVNANFLLVLTPVFLLVIDAEVYS